MKSKVRGNYPKVSVTSYKTLKVYRYGVVNEV